MRRPTRRFVALTLGIIGILCLLVPELTSRLSGHALSGIQEQAITTTAPEDLAANQRRLTDQTPASDFDYGAIQSAPAWQSKPSLDTDSMVGVLEIPSVGLSLPILYGTTNEHLNSAVTAKPRHSVSARRSSGSCITKSGCCWICSRVVWMTNRYNV